MKYTQNLDMKIPEGGDPIDIADITGNFETLDIEINKKANTSGGDISDTTIKTVDAIATEFPVPSAGESSKTFLGKVRKFIQDFIAIKDTLLTLSKLVNNGQTTETGFALDARYGKTLYDLYAQLDTNVTPIKIDLSFNIGALNGYEGYAYLIGDMVFVQGYMNPKVSGDPSSLVGSLPPAADRVLFGVNGFSSSGYGEILKGNTFIGFRGIPEANKNYIFNFSYKAK
jgi:hypothetical protein